MTKENEKLRELIKKYDMYLSSDNTQIGLRKKPENIEEIKKLKPQLIEELKKIQQEKKIQGDPRIGSLSLSYYFVDWYHVNSIFKTEEFGGNQPDWCNNENIFSNTELNKITADYWFQKEKEGKGFVNSNKIVKKLANFFGCKENTKKEDIQEKYPELEIIMREYDDMRGKGEYVSEIIFPDFETFEKYVAIVFQSAIEKTKKYAEKIAAIFEKAKETGEKQLITSYSVECDDEKEECNFDLIYEYAMPDGSKIIDRIHTY